MVWNIKLDKKQVVMQFVRKFQDRMYKVTTMPNKIIRTIDVDAF